MDVIDLASRRVVATTALTDKQENIRYLLSSMFGLIDDYIELVENGEFTEDHALNLAGFTDEILKLQRQSDDPQER